MKILKYLIILFLIITSFNLIYGQEYTTVTVYFLKDFDNYVLNRFQDKIKDLKIKEWIAKHYNEDTKESELNLKFDDYGKMIQLIYVDNVIKRPFTYYYSYDDKNNLVREEKFYEGYAQYQSDKEVILFKRIYDDKGNVIQLFRKLLGGYSEEKEININDRWIHNEKYYYNEKGKIKTIEYYYDNKLHNVDNLNYYDNNNLKEIINNKSGYIKKYDINGNIVYNKILIYDSMIEEKFDYDERSNLIEYKETTITDKLNYVSKLISNKYDDDNNNLIESNETTFNKNEKNKSEIKVFNSYNEKNQLIEEIKYDKDRFKYNYKYEYDDNNNIYKKMDYNKKGINYYIEIYSYKYNEDGLIVEIIKKFGHPQLENRMKIFTFAYEYIK